MTLVLPRDRGRRPRRGRRRRDRLEPGGGELPLDGVVWEVVRDDQGRVVRPVTADARPEGRGPPTPSRARRSSSGRRSDSLGRRRHQDLPALQGRRRLRGRPRRSRAPTKTGSVVYKLLGPHGIPIEGEWYTGTFRDVFFGQARRRRHEGRHPLGLRHRQARSDNPERFQTQPLRFAGVENQYFAAFLEPDAAAEDARGPLGRRGGRRSSSTRTRRHRRRPTSAVEITSRPVEVGPNVPVTHTYKVFAGPKTVEALDPLRRRGPGHVPQERLVRDPVRPVRSPRRSSRRCSTSIYELTARSSPALRRQGGQLRRRDHPADHARSAW